MGVVLVCNVVVNCKSRCSAGPGGVAADVQVGDLVFDRNMALRCSHGPPFGRPAEERLLVLAVSEEGVEEFVQPAEPVVFLCSLPTCDAPHPRLRLRPSMRNDCQWVFEVEEER